MLLRSRAPGPDTLLTGDNVIAVDSVHSLLLVGHRGEGTSPVTHFQSHDSGNVKPKLSSVDPQSLNDFGGPIAVYRAKR